MKTKEILGLGTRLAGLALVAGCFALAAPSFAEEAEKREIRVHKVIECEGEGCDQEAGQVIYLHGRRNGPAARGGYLGVLLNPMTPELRRHEGVPEDAGVMVSRVMDDSPAFRAGLRVGDVVTAVDGKAVTTPRQLAHAIGARDEGEEVVLEVWRDGRAESFTAALEKRAAPAEPHRHVEIRCHGHDCENAPGDFEPYDCGGAEECEVRVHCVDDGCECTVNGDAVDCATIPGPHNDR